MNAFTTTQLGKMKFGVQQVPFVIVGLLAVTVGATLYLTLSQKHVTESLPYISDTGTIPPESCIFGQMMNLLWFLISFIMYIKYRQIACVTEKYRMEKEEMLNRRLLCVGLLAALGSSIVGNFQETLFFFVHWLGALMVFGLGSVYQCMLVVLETRLVPVVGGKKFLKLKTVLAVVSTASFAIFFVTAMLSYYLKEVNDNYLHWKKEDGGFEYHNVSVVSEWICAFSTMSYITLFSEDFKNLTIKAPEVIGETEN